MVLLIVILSVLNILPLTLGQNCTLGFQYFSECAPCSQFCNETTPVCDSICKPGCGCADAKVVNNQGHCINQSECPVVPKICTTEEVLYSKDCAPCEKLCPKTHNGYYQCLLEECETNVCRCKDGYVRDPKENCVSEDKCPQMCASPDEHYYYNLCFAPPCGPPITCAQFLKSILDPPICIMACIITETCACEPGKLFNQFGKCVPIIDCLLFPYLE